MILTLRIILVIENCKYKGKSVQVLASHKAVIHGINLKLFKCDEVDCDYIGKAKEILINIKETCINIYNQQCEERGCDFKCKLISQMRMHKSNIHNTTDDSITMRNNNNLPVVEEPLTPTGLSLSTKSPDKKVFIPL